MAVQQRQQGGCSYAESVSFLERLDSSVQKLGIERVREILETLDNPQDKLPMVHITGTNGKGSTSAILGSLLSATGLRVGMFTSPHLVDMRERIVIHEAQNNQLNSRLIPEDAFTAEFQALKTHLETLGTPRDEWPTYFEWLNIQAYQYFHHEKTDITLFEVGLGGRLDSTNVVKAPNVTVITGIGMDHAHILGDTLEKIAAEKAGIIKEGVPLVLGPCIPEGAKAVILEKAKALNAPVHLADLDSLRIVKDASSLEEGLFISDSKRHLRYHMTLRAPYQMENLATALAVVDCLKAQGFTMTTSELQTGLSQVQWPARFQVLPQHHVIIDGSHNAQGFESLGNALSFYLDGQPIYWLVSLQNNRPLDRLIQLIHETPGTQGVIWTHAIESEARYHNPQQAVEATKAILNPDIPVLAIDDLDAAFSKFQAWTAQSSQAYGIVTGSLYTAGDALALLFMRSM